MGSYTNYTQELNKFYNFVKDAQIITTEQCESYFIAKNITEEVKNKILKTLKRQRMFYVDSAETYCSTSPNIDYNNFTDDRNRAIWTYILYLKNHDISFANFNPKLPASLFLMCDSDANDKWDRTVFYVSGSSVDLSLRLIETNYGGFNDKVKATIIVDDDTYLDKIQLSDGIEIKEIYSIDRDKNIRFYVYNGQNVIQNEV